MALYNNKIEYRSGSLGITMPMVKTETRKPGLILKVQENLHQLPDYNMRINSLNSHESYNKDEHSLYNSLERGYKDETYLRQAVDKYAEKLFTNAHSFNDLIDTTDLNLLKYIKYRFNMFSEAMGTSFLLTLTDMSRKLVRDGKVVLLKSYSDTPIRVPGYSMKKTSTKGFINGYFPIDAKYLFKIKDNNSGEVIGYVYRDMGASLTGIEKIIHLDDVHILRYAPDGTIPEGNSQFTPALADLRALRSLEDGVLKLVYRYLNPLIHVKTPDLNGTTLGDQSEIDIYSSAIENMSHDGFFVTGPQVDIKAIGAESQALRTEGYLNFFKTRSFAGIGLSGLAMGEGNYVNNAGASALSAQMYDRASFYQKLLSEGLTLTIIKDLLGEVGKTLTDSQTGDYRVKFVVPDFDDDEVRKRANHVADLFDKGMLSFEEARLKAGFKDKVNIEDTFYGIKARLDAKYKPASTPQVKKTSTSNNKTTTKKKTNSNA